jgi:hypothetical protein
VSFALFIVLNAILLIRPEDFLPEIAGLRLYLILIVVNVMTALPRIIDQLRPNELVKRPITVCVLGLLVATALSHLVRGRIGMAMDFVPEFAKVVIYYLLLVAVVDTPSRLRTFLGLIVPLVMVVALLGILQMHEVIDYEALRPSVQQAFDPEVGTLVSSARMCGPGVFNDPNDMCLVLTFGIICALYRGATARNYALSALWWSPIALFGYGIVLTQSRGGLLGLLAAVAALLIARFGWRRALPFVAVALPAAVFVIGGRQSNIGVADTAHERIMLWAAGLSELSRAPLYLMTGIGAGLYEDTVGQVAHNSFVHAYVELGLLGGALFLVAFVLAVRVLYSLRPEARPQIPRGLAAFQPFLMAMVVGYAAGMYSLSRNYIVPTYLCLGIAQAYLTLAMPKPPAEYRLSPVWAKQTALVGVGGLVFLKFFTQFAGSMGL